MSQRPIFTGMKREINIRDYTYELPADRIAIHPLEQRDRSKLLVYTRGTISHEPFKAITEHIPSNTTLYFNNTKVIQARLLFRKESGATIEIFLLNPTDPSPLLMLAMQATSRCRWRCTIGNLKRWKEGVILTKTSESIQLAVSLVDRAEGIVEFSWKEPFTFAQLVDVFGETPLPPYLKRPASEEDKTRYQTVYSREEGAVAAPTAGLHFSEKILQELHKKGIKSEFVTLHVSAGTFQPVKTENAAEHPMHREQIIITKRNIQSLLEESRTTLAVGTTSMRSLESLYWYGVKLGEDPNSEFNILQDDAYKLKQDLSPADALRNVLNRMDRDKVDLITGETAVYIMPGYKFRICQALVTNFHQPGSTLILLVAAFVGDDWRKIYQEALANNYRFLSYGDSSLLMPRDIS